MHKELVMEIKPQHLNVMFSPNFAVPVFGYIVPPLAVLVLLVNLPMIWTLSMRHMRSPANNLMICIAISDTLVIVMPVVPFVYFYTLGFYKDYVPFAWCSAFFSLVHVFPLLCNMLSLWATVALAVMRCYSVWRPLQAKLTITTFRTQICIGFIFLISFVVYVPIIFEYTYIPLTAQSMVKPNYTISSCHMEKSKTHLSENFCVVHTWLQILLTSLLPWFLITFPNFGLLWKLKKSEDGLRTTSDDRKLVRYMFFKSRLVSRTRTTTWMIFIVVSMIWMVEIPFAVSFTRYLTNSNGDVMNKSLGDSFVIVFVLKYITYPVIFIIYCFMSQKFRKTFQDVLECRTKRKHLPVPLTGMTPISHRTNKHDMTLSLRTADKISTEDLALESTNI